MPDGDRAAVGRRDDGDAGGLAGRGGAYPADAGDERSAAEEVRRLTEGLVMRNGEYFDGRSGTFFGAPTPCTPDEERAEERKSMIWFVFGPPVHPAALR